MTAGRVVFVSPPLCVCGHLHADHQQPVEIAGECDLCDCDYYTEEI